VETLTSVPGYTGKKREAALFLLPLQLACSNLPMHQLLGLQPSGTAGRVQLLILWPLTSQQHHQQTTAAQHLLTLLLSSTR
jgi:hypothetical protein